MDLCGLITRSLNGEKPKYTERISSDYIFWSLPDDRIRTDALPAELHQLSAVLVEDTLSAIRVGRILQCGSLLGTSAADAALLDIKRVAALSNTGLVQTGSQVKVAVWLDGDKAGRTGSRRIGNRLRLVGVEPVFIRTDKDPKYYSNREIKEILLAGLESPSSAQAS